MKIVKAKVQGYCIYYGITDNLNKVSKFIDDCKRLIYKWLNRRSQRNNFN